MWSVVGRLVAPTPSDAKAALGEARQWATGVFNYQRPGGADDGARRQLALPDARAPVASRLAEAARAALVARGANPGEAVALYSGPGCQQQAPHTDYDPDEVDRLASAGVERPDAFLVALMRGTRLMVEGRAVRLQVGDALRFDGGVVHAGAAYADENVRLHFYAQTDDRLLARDRTFLVV